MIGHMSKTTVIGIERILDIFEAFEASEKPLSLTELAELTNIPKSTCHAIVGTLQSRGYLYSLTRPRALYPTRRMLDAATAITRKDPFTERAIPVLERLRDSTRETVILGKRQGDNIIYLHVIDGLNAIRYSAKAGDLKPLCSTSIGKAILGSLKEPELRQLLADKTLPAVTNTTITDKEMLVQDILQSRRAGFFQTRGENVLDVWAVAAFLNVNKETLGVAVAGPAHRLESNLQECAHLLVATCSFLARQLNG